MRTNIKTVVGSFVASAGLVLLSAAPVAAAPAFSDHLLQFISGGATNVIDFNQGTSQIFNDSQLYIATDDWLILNAGQEVVVSNNIGVGGNTRTNTLNVVGSATVGGTLSGLTGLTVNSGGVTVTSGGATITAGGLTVNGGTGKFGTTTPVHLVSAQTTAPTAVASITGVSAASVAGTDTKGVITTTGTPSATGTVTVTFNAAYASAPVVVITPSNASGNAALAYVSSATTTTFVITTTAATPGATPSWNYHAIQ